jgi:thymidylate synthase (FAD)
MTTEIKVLNDGFVRLVDSMGDDNAIVQAARVSYGDGTKTKREDEKLIAYLLKHRHTSPFEQVVLKFHVRVPMDCWRQWIRHRTASVNEYSTRYSVAIDSMQTTAPYQWRLQATDNKQGSGGFLDAYVGRVLSCRETDLHDLAREIYQERLKCGVAREQARKDLPLSTYTEAYWKIDLHNLFHFLGLRLDHHAQLEIRTYAIAVAALASHIVPVAWKAFVDHVLAPSEITGTKSYLDSLEKIKEKLQINRNNS